ncbi:MAG: STAS domain-containing protein [Candidatus Limnocylindria bacterium]
MPAHEPSAHPEADTTPLVVLCHVGAARAELGTVDALARLALSARRLGCAVRLRDASPELGELVELVGLADVMLCVRGSGGEPRG